MCEECVKEEHGFFQLYVRKFRQGTRSWRLFPTLQKWAAIVGGVEGGARIITQGGGKGTWMPIHTLCHVTHVVPYSQRDSHPYATHAITYSAPWALPCACSTSHITLNRVALQSSWHGPNEFKWSPPLSCTLSYSPSAGGVLVLLSLVWSKPLFDNCLMRL